MNELLDIHNKAEIFYKSCSRQKDIFNYWLGQRSRESYYDTMGFDTETTGVDFNLPSYLWISDKTQARVPRPTAFGVSMCIKTNEGLALFWGRIGTRLFDDMCRLLKRRGRKAAHNASFDLRVLRGQGVDVAGDVRCTLTMSRMVYDDRKNHTLQKIVERLCPEMSGWEEPIKAEIKRVKAHWTRRRKKLGLPFIKDYANYSFIDDKIMRRYAITDAFWAYIVFIRMANVTFSLLRELDQREHHVMWKTLEVEEAGLRFNSAKARRESAKLERRCERLIRRIQRSLGRSVNPESPKQLLKAMTRKGFTPEELQWQGEPSTRKEVLQRILATTKSKTRKKIASNILDLRTSRLLVNRYLVPLSMRADLNDGVVYCNINTADTRTGRMAISQPSLQNLPRPGSGYHGHNPVRACFGPRAHHTWWLFDFSQIEMVYFCFLAKAWDFIKAYMDGADIHAEMAYVIHGKRALDRDGNVDKALRQATKAINFGIIYGMGLPAIAQELHIGLSRANEIMEMYLKKIPEISAFAAECRDEVELRGHIDCYFGKRYHARPEKAYTMVNKRVQGGCAQILKIAFLRTVRAFGRWRYYGTRVLLPIHDELIIERRNPPMKQDDVFVWRIKKEMSEIPQLMEKGLKLRVDVKRTTTNWGEAKSYKLNATA